MLAPVYDVVTPEDRVRFYEKDPHNAIRLELTKSVAEEASTDYAEVAQTLAALGKLPFCHRTTPAYGMDFNGGSAFTPIGTIPTVETGLR